MGMEYFTGRRTEIRTRLSSFTEEMTAGYATLAPWAEDLGKRLESFTSGGKMIRGSLVFLGAELSGGGSEPGLTDAALAMEMIQSAFLIHDDIMDRDTLRRGKPSLYWQYRNLGAGDGLSDAGHYGESMGICAGDAALFFAFLLLAGPGIPQSVSGYTAREVAAVALAQMKDVHSGTYSRIPSVEEILHLYRWKTGRYSFSLPLAAGAMLAGASETMIKRLETIGENIGIAFQMRDDELGLFGDEAVLGKPVGSDLREGKKTMVLSMAHARMKNSDRERLEAVLNNNSATEADLLNIRDSIAATGVREELSRNMARLASEAERLVSEGGFPEEPRETLLALLRFVTERET